MGVRGRVGSGLPCVAHSSSTRGPYKLRGHGRHYPPAIPYPPGQTPRRTGGRRGRARRTPRPQTGRTQRRSRGAPGLPPRGSGERAPPRRSRSRRKGPARPRAPRPAPATLAATPALARCTRLHRGPALVSRAPAKRHTHPPVAMGQISRRFLDHDGLPYYGTAQLPPRFFCAPIINAQRATP